jgi:lipopolysaccharide/colanic/teichoic acid biosynthesis glycosyltransferase
MIPCYKSVKSFTDKAIAILLAVVFAPVILLIIVVLFLTQEKVWFVQQRPGFLEQPFYLYKFATMCTDTSKPDAQRITPVGSILRKLSLDELPQLFNIIKGEMSFIGPRPFLMEYLPLYSSDHRRRHFVLPGITGLAQVSGKNEVSWPKKLDLDVYYVDHHSFWLDLKIVGLTISYFLKGCPGSYPATKFSGYSTVSL